MVPGGMSTRVEVENKVLISWLAKQSKKSKIVASVCSGSALLAKSGVLDGLAATTNKMFFQSTSSVSSKVNWQTSARWVQAGNIYTSSGVSAGMDMTLAIIAFLHSTEVAEKVAIGAEYEWHRDSSYDPFAKLHGLV